jgi:hypothetical protein
MVFESDEYQRMNISDAFSWLRFKVMHRMMAIRKSMEAQKNALTGALGREKI